MRGFAFASAISAATACSAFGLGRLVMTTGTCGHQFFHTVGNRDAGFRHLLAPRRIGIDACDDPAVGDQVAREGATHDAQADNADHAFRSCRHLKPPLLRAFLATRVRYYMASGAGGRPAKGQGSCMRPRVYVTQPIAESALMRLKEIAEVELNDDSSRIRPKPS